MTLHSGKCPRDLKKFRPLPHVNAVGLREIPAAPQCRRRWISNHNETSRHNTCSDFWKNPELVQWAKYRTKRGSSRDICSATWENSERFSLYGRGRGTWRNDELFFLNRPWNFEIPKFPPVWRCHLKLLNYQNILYNWNAIDVKETWIHVEIAENTAQTWSLFFTRSKFYINLETHATNLSWWLWFFSPCCLEYSSLFSFLEKLLHKWY